MSIAFLLLQPRHWFFSGLFIFFIFFMLYALLTMRGKFGKRENEEKRKTTDLLIRPNVHITWFIPFSNGGVGIFFILFIILLWNKVDVIYYCWVDEKLSRWRCCEDEDKWEYIFFFFHRTLIWSDCPQTEKINPVNDCCPIPDYISGIFFTFFAGKTFFFSSTKSHKKKMRKRTEI